ncbi:cytochrome P450 4V2-like isoform X2 [Odontomachus brunneus]|uniref:cytochrome P450 4V2-like isoform X2 n=1 Tax=Odontomachus brunneus TaxID=486640 RepID=UPI0013F21C22|nr:cytochrome P450 4V2-like isoform X2 [Odontomachus brunneus]
METSDEGKKFTRKEIIDEIVTIITAGTDTTAITLNFMMFMLANFPEIQQKVYEELLEIYGTQNPKSAPVNFEDLQHMNYLVCVIKETLRIFPVAPLIGRQLNEDLLENRFAYKQNYMVKQYIRIIENILYQKALMS